MKKHVLIAEARRLNKKLRSMHFSIYRDMLLKLCSAYHHFDFVPALEAGILASDWDSVIEMADSLSSQLHDDATRHFVANQFASLVRKFDFPQGSTSFDPEGEAVKRFLRSEHCCSRINQRFRARRLRKKGVHPYESHMSSMRSFVAYVLGFEVPLAKIYDEVGFGPGASLGVHGNATNVMRKLSSDRWTVSPGAFHYAYGAVMKHAQIREVLLPDHAGFSSGCPEVDFQSFSDKCEWVNHNNITFVPKTAKTFRSIAVEPLLNGLVQKGIDNVMRRRLKRIGIDLADQEPNRQMARIGSLDDEDSFVTIDLSSASDSISIEIVRELLPPDWFAFLNAVRSKSYAYDGRITRFHKFCSMGNGFCFPLETLIFTAACDAVKAGVPGKDFRVYGDDIIVKKRFAPALLDLLSYMGFSVNTDKTFLSGPFRESCGADWFGGEDVRPFILDFRLDSIQALFKILNLSRRSSRTESFFSDVRPFLLSLIPQSLRLLRPGRGEASSGIDAIGNEFMASRNCRFNSDLQCWEYRELGVSPKGDTYPYQRLKSGNAIHMYGALSGSASSMPFTLRRSTRTKVRWKAYSGATSTWLPAS